jgi:hypothetical protein
LPLLDAAAFDGKAHTVRRRLVGALHRRRKDAVMRVRREKRHDVGVDGTSDTRGRKEERGKDTNRNQKSWPAQQGHWPGSAFAKVMT